ncbi:MAG: hypothetical protein AABX59_03120 [Nanoarchaeota archaeon]
MIADLRLEDCLDVVLNKFEIEGLSKCPLIGELNLIDLRSGDSTKRKLIVSKEVSFAHSYGCCLLPIPKNLPLADAFGYQLSISSLGYFALLRGQTIVEPELFPVGWVYIYSDRCKKLN